MALAHQAWTVKIYQTLNKASDELVGEISDFLTWPTWIATRLQGGFKDATFSIGVGSQTSVGRRFGFAHAWEAMKREHLRGWHFYHIEVLEDERIVWEGRIARVSIEWDARGLRLQIYAQGYWASCRDQLYDNTLDGGTDFSATASSFADMIKDLLTQKCPDINSDQSNIGSDNNSMTTTELDNDDWPQNHIVDHMAGLGDASGDIWNFAVWEDRLPFWTARDVSTIDWFGYLEDIERGNLTQSVTNQRGTIETTNGSTTGSDIPSNYPTRELEIAVPSGVSSAVEQDIREAAAAEKKFPQQDQEFVFKRIYSAKLGQVLGSVSGARMERPLWWVRAGDSLQIVDLVPQNVATPALDALRTFFIMETQYDAIEDTLLLVPDRARADLGSLMSRDFQLEAAR